MLTIFVDFIDDFFSRLDYFGKSHTALLHLKGKAAYENKLTGRGRGLF